MSISFANKLSKIVDLNGDENDPLNVNKNILDNKNVQNTSNKCLYVRKIDEKETSNAPIIKAIYDSFNNPDDYFSVNSPVRVNSNVELKKIVLFDNRDKKKLTNRRSPQKKPNMNVSRISDVSRSIPLKDKQNNNLTNNNNYEIIDYNTLKNIFEYFKTENLKNKENRINEMSISRHINTSNLNRSNNYSISNIEDKNNSNNNIYSENNNVNYPYDLYKSLDYQNKQINAKKKNEKKVTNMSKFISKKISKDEEDLLINKVDLFKYKRDILTGINKEKIQDEKFGKFQWNMSLRRPSNFKGKRELFVNVNTDRDPLWGLLVERSPNHKELAVKPGYNLNQKEFVKFEKNENIQKNKEHLNTVKNLDGLNVNGSNLLDLEYKREMSTKGRKVLHKVFVENGKTILDQDINKVFGEETFYRNYENKHKYNYNLNDDNSDINRYEGENVHYKYGQNGKRSRIISSISRSLDRSIKNSNSPLPTDF